MDAGTAGAGGSDEAGPPTFVLASTAFLKKGSDWVFPASALFPTDQSPPFSWSGAPAQTKSFALTFVDQGNGATKWVVWNIPPTVAALPANLSKDLHPIEIPAATQRGSLGRTGYSGPAVQGHTYEFILWALDVDILPNTDGKTTEQLRTTILPMHRIQATPPLVAKYL
jgi:Raf kinase inhibitor-like YbhB/YbcL family protein